MSASDRPRAATGTVGVIPARWGSTRFPGKSLTPICGRPLIHWVLERAQQARVQAQLLEGGRHDPERARRGARVRRLERALFPFSLSRAFYYPTTIIA